MTGSAMSVPHPSLREEWGTRVAHVFRHGGIDDWKKSMNKIMIHKTPLTLDHKETIDPLSSHPPPPKEVAHRSTQALRITHARVNNCTYSPFLSATGFSGYDGSSLSPGGFSNRCT